MNGLPNEADSKTLAFLQRIDGPCQEFENEWRSGNTPDVSAYLNQAREEDRPGFLGQLLCVEWTYRSKRQQSVDLSEYARRFHQWPKVVEESWQRWQKSDSSVYNTVAPTGGGVNPQSVARALVGLPGLEQYAFLGAGGMAEVWKAWKPSMKRYVALKQMRGDQVTPARLARFRKETETLSQMRHPHIVQVYAYHEREGCPVQELEFVAGGALEERLGNRVLAPMEAAKLVSILAWAVQAAHNKGIVHRDLKPANVLMDDPVPGDSGNVLGGYPKIADFGLAIWGEEGQRDTVSGMVMGTPAYMSPEQAMGLRREVGPATDVWALGVILYRCLTGELPFKGDSVLETLDLVRTMKFKPLREVSPDVPADLAAICMQCLLKEIVQRPTAAELAGLLEGVVAGGTQEDKTPVDGVKLAERVVTPRVELPRREWVDKWRIWLGVGALTAGVLGLVVTLGWIMIKMRDRPLQVTNWNVLHYQPDGFGQDDLLGVMGPENPVTRYLDKLIIEVELSQPAYCYLIAFNFDGKEQLLLPCDLNDNGLPGDLQRKPEKQAALRYPPLVEPAQGFELSDDEKGGLQAFVVVASRQPLPPYAEWRKTRGNLPWTRLPGGDRVWVSEGDKLEPLTPIVSKQRGRVVPLIGEPPLVELVRWARDEGKVVRGIAFPVNPWVGKPPGR